MGSFYSSNERVLGRQYTKRVPERASTSHGTSQAEFDVFLSFRGSDTRANFTDSLYHALRDQGIRVFIDKKRINIGEEIGPRIFKAIDNSKIGIAILSTGYASSKWCMSELKYMMERRTANELEVLPIFYDVEPSDVKLETRRYKDALTLHKARLGAEIVNRWAEALKEVTKIKGWDTKELGHGELTRQIARKVLVKLKVSPVHLPYHLVGIDQSVDEVINLMSVKSKDVRLVGICGIDAIGKTTLAKVVYQKLSVHFESSSFISDVQQTSEGSSFGLLNLQKQLVHDILGDKTIEVSSIDEGKNMIQERFSGKQVLIVLDDVNHRSQLMALAAKREWFGPGSRIVVTTRDKNVLSAFLDQFENGFAYEVEGLNHQESLRLFSNHAFRSNSPPSGFLRLSESIIAKTGGLPLTIEVMGSFLYQKKKAVWKNALKKMENSLHVDVEKKLRSSYEALDDKQKEIFLDIACFVAGENKRNATYMWDDCELFPDEGIEVLQFMFLIKTGVKNELWMHDQLKNLGRSIVRSENRGNPGARSRVWNHEEALDMITRKKGTKTVEAICVNLEGTVLTAEEFREVPNLRFLQMISGNLSGDFEDLFSEVRWLSWKNCPLNLQATNICPKNLLILDIVCAGITESWNGWTLLEVATRLKVLTLSMCPNICGVPSSIEALVNLERLAIIGAPMLTTLPDSLGKLKSLVELDVSETGIAELPNTIIHLKRLKVLKMNRSRIQKLPEKIGMLKKLEEIHGEQCLQLEMIPGDIARLAFLKILKLTETRVENVPKLPKSLVNVCLSSSASKTTPGISNLVNLRNQELWFPATNQILTTFPKKAPDISSPCCFLELPSITRISSDLGCLRCLKELQLNNCKNLREIGQLPSSLRKLTVDDCDLLEVVDLSNLENLLELSLQSRISQIQGLQDLASLQLLRVTYCKSSKFSGLEKLENLRFLFITSCLLLRKLPDLSNCENLKEFLLWDCPKLVEIQGLDKLESLESLEIGYCTSLQSLPDLSDLERLKHCYVDFLSLDIRR